MSSTGFDAFATAATLLPGEPASTPLHSPQEPRTRARSTASAVACAVAVCVGILAPDARAQTATNDGAVTGATNDEAFSAPSDVDRARARDAFRAGVEGFDRGAYEDALREFRLAYEIAPHPSVRLNIANCYLQLGRDADALTVFEAYLAETADSPTPRRAEVARRTRALRGRMATLRVALGPGVSPPQQLEVRVDGQRAETFRGVAHAAPGWRAVTVNAVGLPTLRGNYRLAAGEQRDVGLPMVGGPAGGRERANLAYESLRWGVAGLGVGLFVATGVGLAGASRSGASGSCALAWNLVPLAGPVLGTAWDSDCTRRDRGAFWAYAVADTGLQLAGLILVVAGALAHPNPGRGPTSSTPSARAGWYVLPLVGAAGPAVGVTVGAYAF